MEPWPVSTTKAPAYRRRPNNAKIMMVSKTLILLFDQTRLFYFGLVFFPFVFFRMNTPTSDSLANISMVLLSDAADPNADVSDNLLPNTAREARGPGAKKSAGKKEPKLSKGKQKEAQRREAAKAVFSRFFSSLYAENERWASLLPALEAPVRYSCVLNKHATGADIVQALTLVEDRVRVVDWLSGIKCVVVDEDEAVSVLEEKGKRVAKPFPPPVMDLKNIKTHYLMDAASILATEGLDIQPNDTVLDMCAAPGGKSFCILQRLGPHGRLIANEMSNDRRTRLRKVLKEYIPASTLDTCVSVTGFDGTKRDNFPPDTYPKVLCDAPCSSERHVLHDEEELLQWSPTRTKNSAKRQRLLLAHALRTALDDGGRVVYATCSISRSENDAVVEKVLRKTPYHVRVLTHERVWAVGEPTEFGWIVLPDTVGRWGPLFFCVLEKRGRKDGASGEGLDVDVDD